MRALVSLLLLLVPVHDPAPVTYAPPVVAPVTDPFRPPATPFGPGNRGIEYDTGPGVEVTAAAAGTVAFAGSVAGRRYVTLLHADRVRTAYGPLARLDVQVRSDVDAGEILGTTAGRLLWTARIGDAYIDPAVLLAASGRRDVHLVATTPARGSVPARAPVAVCAAAWALSRPC